ncbi:MAG: hypothetical protein Kow00124_05420 [Anaerolineae bacterium]
MMAHGFWLGLLGAAAALTVGLLLYWQLVIAEGALIGQWLVTLLYDLTARQYDGIKQFDAEMEAIFLGRPIVEMLRHTPAPLVLDIGTGTGRLPLALLEQPGFQGRVIGVDASRRMIEIAAQKAAAYGDRLTLIWREGDRLPFPDGAFDCVTCLEMLEFTRSPQRQIAEAARVLRPGGLLVVTRRRGPDARLMPGKTHSAAAFTALLEGMGFRDVTRRMWQVDYDLHLAWQGGPPTPPGPRGLLEVLRCPRCDQIDWQLSPDRLGCAACGAHYAVRRGVIHMPHRGRTPLP